MQVPRPLPPAGAVIGPETPIHASTAKQFGHAQACAILGETSAGAAMLQFRADMLRGPDPLGFVFRAYGNADLAIEPRARAARRAGMKLQSLFDLIDSLSTLRVIPGPRSGARNPDTQFV